MPSLEESLSAEFGGGDAPHRPRQVGARTAVLLLPTGRSSRGRNLNYPVSHGWKIIPRW